MASLLDTKFLGPHHLYAQEGYRKPSVSELSYGFEAADAGCGGWDSSGHPD